jgi:catechol 2,3-dioxygenase-like lactoylglutathione lyase family enzyme
VSSGSGDPSLDMSSITKTKSLDHLVLTIKDLDATIEFYENVLGMVHESFFSTSSPEVKRHALKFGTQKINLHISGHEFEPKAQTVQPGSADLCFLVHESVDDVLGGLKAKNIDVLEGGQVVERTGAQGKLRRYSLPNPLALAATDAGQVYTAATQMATSLKCLICVSRMRLIRRILYISRVPKRRKYWNWNPATKTTCASVKR